MNYKILARAAAAVVVAALVCSSAGASRAAGEPLEIHTILSLTGQGAFLGKAAQTTLAILEAKVNKAGGINGRPIKFVEYDDTSSPQVDVQLANQLIAKKVPVVLGPEITASCNAIGSMFRDGPVLYCLSSSYHPERGGYTFAYGVEANDIAATIVRYLREHGLKRIAFLGSLDASGQDGERSFDAALARPENKDITVVERQHFVLADQTVLAQLARVKSSGAQALYTWAVGTPMGTIYHGIQDSGLDIPVTVAGVNTINAQMKQYGDILPRGMVANGMAFMVPDSLPRGPLKSSVHDFSEALKTATGERADFGYTIAWDPASIIVDAFKKVGANATPQQLRDYIDSLHSWTGVTGMYDFSDGNNRGIDGASSMVIVRWDAAKSNWVAVSKFGGGL